MRNLLAAVDPNAEVLHNYRAEGRLSGIPRQIDIWVAGTVAGIDLRVAVECKRYSRSLNVEVVDQFVGKLLDIGADRGVLYSYSGFSSAAVLRCARAANPNVLAVALETPAIAQELHGVPGYPADLLVQDVAPQWVEELDQGAFESFLEAGIWNKFWSGLE